MERKTGRTNAGEKGRKAQPRFSKAAQTHLPAELQLPGGPSAQGGTRWLELYQAPARYAPGVPCERPRCRSARRDLWSGPRAGRWGWQGGGQGPGAGTGPSPVTSCRAAGAGAAPQRLHPRRPRQVRLPLPLTPGPAAPASSVATPPLPSCRPFLLSFLLPLLAVAAAAQDCRSGDELRAAAR